MNRKHELRARLRLSGVGRLRLTLGRDERLEERREPSQSGLHIAP